MKDIARKYDRIIFEDPDIAGVTFVSPIEWAPWMETIWYNCLSPLCWFLSPLCWYNCLYITYTYIHTYITYVRITTFEGSGTSTTFALHTSKMLCTVTVAQVEKGPCYSKTSPKPHRFDSYIQYDEVVMDSIC